MLPCAISFVPATTPSGQPHYDAIITVPHGDKVIAVFGGLYTDNGCFEDDLDMLVKLALDIQAEERKQKEKKEGAS